MKKNVPVVQMVVGEKPFLQLLQRLGFKRLDSSKNPKTGNEIQLWGFSR